MVLLVRDDLFPVALRLELVGKVTSEIRVEMGGWDELKKVGVEAHL